ncbi:MAG TPA: hypothetical protein VNM92_00655 [Thermoanaerobaculia bacterium]|nr:hypothetical protein [Thermoanaerobaculia bacterium]
MRNLIVALVSSALATAAMAAPTRLTVRAISRDAKVLGDGVGGARITIRDLESGKILASGIQRGGTGDTKRIMQEPRQRGAMIYDTENAAAFRTTFELSRVTRVEITAEGPLKYPQAMQRASKTMLLVPGQDITGEGVLLEIAGFIVEIESTDLVQTSKQPVNIRSKVTMTCGCPTEPGGMWNADEITVIARAIRGGRVAGETQLRYADSPSTFEGELPELEDGRYMLEVFASDAKRSNVGRASRALVVQKSTGR